MMTSLTRNKWIAFHNGRPLPDLTLDWIIGSALRGKITPSNAFKIAPAQVAS